MVLRRLVAVLVVLAALVGTVPLWAQRAGAEPLPQEQARVRERMQDIERRLLELAGIAEETWRREALRSALRASRGGLVVSRMAEIASLLEQGRYAEAASREQEVLAELRRLADLLSVGETEATLAGLRDAERMLAELARRQSDLLRKTADMAGDGGRRSDRLRAAEEQAALQSTLQALLPELTGAAAQQAAAAHQHMAGAAQALQEAAPASAMASQQDAGDALAAARDALRREIARLEAERRARARRGVRGILGEMARELAAIRTETEALPLSPENGDRVPRSVRLRLMELSERQRDLLRPADEALSLLDNFGATAAWPAALEYLKGRITEAADLLSRGERASAVAAQAELAETLRELLAALQPARPDADRTEPAPPQGRTSPGRGRPEGASDVRMAEELKVLRAMQAELSRSTARAADRKPRAAGGEELSRLARRQSVIRRALEELRRLSEGGAR